MIDIDNMSMSEIDAAIATLRERRQQLISSNKIVDRRIAVLERRRERMMEKVNEIDDQIITLRVNTRVATLVAPKRRRMRPSDGSPKSNILLPRQ